jgi:uncharacterized protein (DUF58 family)
MEENYYDGKIRGNGDAIVRATVVGTAIVIAWNAPYAWYWRIGIFVVIMFALGIIYPTAQLALARRRERRRSRAVVEYMLADSKQEADDFVKTMNAMSEGLKAKGK